MASRRANSEFNDHGGGGPAVHGFNHPMMYWGAYEVRGGVTTWIEDGDTVYNHD